MLDKRLAWTSAAVIVVIMAAVVAVSIPTREDALPMQETVSDVEVERPAEEPGYLYVLKEYQGRIAVYTADSAEPEMVLDVQVKYLPDYDREQMQQGVPVSSYSELVALIEDYTS